VRRKPARSLMSLHQGLDELLKDYFRRFNIEKLGTESATDDFIYGALYQGIRKDGPLMVDLAQKSPQYLHRFMDKAEEFINQGETLRAHLGLDQSKASISEGSKQKKKGTWEEGPAEPKKSKKSFKDYT
jgi:hypothetical protein